MFNGIGEAERIGDFGIIGGGGAGWEIDRVDAELGTPPHALVVGTASQFTSVYHWVKEELTHTHSANTSDTLPQTASSKSVYISSRSTGHEMGSYRQCRHPALPAQERSITVVRSQRRSNQYD